MRTLLVSMKRRKAIYVGAPDKRSGKRRQSIHICYDLIGFIPLSELIEQRMA